MQLVLSVTRNCDDKQTIQSCELLNEDRTLNELFYGYDFINELLHTVNSKLLGFERGVLYILHIDSAT